MLEGSVVMISKSRMFLLFQRSPSSGNLPGFETGGGRATTTTTNNNTQITGNGHDDAHSTRSGDTPGPRGGAGGGTGGASDVNSTQSIRDDTSDAGMDMFAGRSSFI